RLLVADGLERFREDDVVEGVVGERCQALLEVELKDVDVVLDALEHFRVRDLDAVAGRLALLPQVLQQLSVAAAEVEDARALRDPAGDVVGFGHSAMLLKYARSAPK